MSSEPWFRLLSEGRSMLYRTSEQEPKPAAANKLKYYMRGECSLQPNHNLGHPKLSSTALKVSGQKLKKPDPRLINILFSKSDVCMSSTRRYLRARRLRRGLARCIRKSNPEEGKPSSSRLTMKFSSVVLESFRPFEDCLPFRTSSMSLAWQSGRIKTTAKKGR